MKTTVNTSVEIVLHLTEEEARWLRCVMQNPLYGAAPEDEPEEDKEMRSKFFLML